MAKQATAVKDHVEAGQFASRNGYFVLGNKDCEIEKDLSDHDKENLLSSMSEAIETQESLQQEIKDFKKKLDPKIKECSTIIHESAKIVNRGTKFETETRPCFFDKVKNQRVFVDFETMNEHREDATPEDHQMTIDD